MLAAATLALGAIFCDPQLGQAAVDLGTSAATCPVPPAPAPAATVPPELLKLNEKAHRLHLKTVRFSINLTLAAERGVLSFNYVASANVTTDESTSVLSTRIAAAGKTIHKETSRQLQIGTTVYRLDRGVGRRDGGRPWVREHGESSHGTPESDSLVPPAQQLAKAESIVELPGSVDGQPVTKFTATFAPGAAPPSAALPFSGTESCPRTVSITMSFAPSGLPVLTSTRAEYLTEGHPMTATQTIHLLATNFHFKPLKSPPASKTISAASLERPRKSERSESAQEERHQ